MVTDDYRQALLAAGKLIGRQLHIRFTEPVNSGWFRDQNPVGEMALASGINYRQVALPGRWWQADCGPLLGFKKNGNPVALLPSCPSGYQAYDSLQNTWEKVTADWPEKLEPLAYVFYRPFGADKIKLANLLDYAAKAGIGKDLPSLLLTGTGAGLCGLVLPVAAGYLFDHVLPLGNRTLLLQLLVILAAVSLSAALFKSVALTVFLRLETRLEAAVQGAVWDRLLRLPAPFFRHFQAGQLADRALHISKIRSIIAGSVADSLVSSLFLLFYWALLLWYHPPTAIISLLYIMAGALAMAAMGRFQIKYQKTGLLYAAQAAGLRAQWLEAIPKLRTAGAEQRAFQLWEAVFDRKKDIDFKNGLLQNGMTAFSAVFISSAYVLVFYAAANTPSLTTGTFVTIFIAFTALFTTLLQLFNAIPQLAAVVPLYEDLKPILETCPESGKGKLPPGHLDGDISLDKVSFRYAPQGAYALKDLTLHIKSGEYLGIVGASGSGKSTLLRLLAGLEKAESGKIRYGAVELAAMDLPALRRQLGVVLQNSRLIPGDIFYNITGGEARLTMDDAWAAAGLAGLEEEIKNLPMGMHTMISEETKTISGGQKQRILLARALVQKPKILFLDEATSALDNQTQEMIQKTLAAVNATRIVVAHRFSTVRMCHRIVVMEQGKIVEEGTFAELMRQRGTFAGLAQRQIL